MNLYLRSLVWTFLHHIYSTRPMTNKDPPIHITIRTGSQDMTIAPVLLEKTNKQCAMVINTSIHLCTQLLNSSSSVNVSSKSIQGKSRLGFPNPNGYRFIQLTLLSSRKRKGFKIWPFNSHCTHSIHAQPFWKRKKNNNLLWGGE